MANNAVWWEGNDKNVWYKDSSGTRNVGKLLKSYNGGFDAERLSGLGNRINDPLAESDTSKWLRESQAQLNALMSQINARPKLAQFDVMGNWRQAQSAAEKAQNPLYEQKLNTFLQQQAAKKATKNKEFNLNVENIGQEKTNTLGENQINRTRTAEDTANAINKINTVEGDFQTDEGQQFDQNYRQVAEQVAASGGAQTGLGRQTTSDMVRLRNVTSQRQLDEFQGQREAKQLFKTRTFEDLMRGDQQAEQLATSKTKAAQFDLDKYLEDLSFDEQNFRFDNEQQRLEAVLRDTQNYEKTGVEQFLAGLAGQGYGAQDIAYNRQVYA